MEQQHGDRVGQPVLLARLVDAADPVDAALDRPQHRRQERALAVEHARHVPAERLDQRDDEQRRRAEFESSRLMVMGMPLQNRSGRSRA